MSETNRRKFLAAAGAGAAAGVVGITAGPAFAGGGAVRSTKAAKETVVAYVEDHHGSTRHAAGRRARGRRPRPRPGHPHPQRGRGRVRCRRTAKHPRSPRTPSPTAPTPTRSSVPTSPARHPDRQLHPAAAAGRRPELLRVRRRRRLRHQDREQRQGQGGHRLPLPVHDEDPQPEDLPLQHRPDHQHQRPELEPAAVLLRHPHRGRPQQGAGLEPALPAGQRRQAEYAELRSAVFRECVGLSRRRRRSRRFARGRLGVGAELKAEER